MAAVTTTRVPRSWTGPTTHTSGRTTRSTYVRRRIAAVALGIAIVVGAAQAGAALGGSALAAPERRPASTAHTVVRAGDSLWSVASRLAPGEDPRPIVDALAVARHGTPLVVGERIEWDG
jgi:hypothetical protein